MLRPRVFPKAFTFVPPPERPGRPERREASLKRILNERIRQPNWMGSTVNIGPLGINVVISDVIPHDAIYFTIPESSSGLMKMAITVDDDQIAPGLETIPDPSEPRVGRVGRIENLHVPGMDLAVMNMRQRMESIGIDVDEETRRIEQEISQAVGVPREMLAGDKTNSRRLSPVEIWNS